MINQIYAVTSITEDVDVVIQTCDIKACHRIGKYKEKFVSPTYCNKALIKRRNLININSQKYNFSNSNTFFINENFTCTNDSIAFCGREQRGMAKFIPVILWMELFT